MNEVQLGEYIKKQRKQKFSKLEAFAIATGINKGTLSKIERGLLSKNISPFTLQCIARALEIDYKILYSIIGYLTDDIQSSSSKDTKGNIDMNKTLEFLEIPLYGSISAGYGSDDTEFIEMLIVPGLKQNGNTYFAVNVEGDSMEPKVPNGSVIVIKKDVEIEPNKIGAFSLNGEFFVKQKKIINNKLVLHSFNMAYEPKVIQEYDDYKELGKVIKVMIDV